jgi:regulator of sirC expression with transglutaminase-like and TPR domain
VVSVRHEGELSLFDPFHGGRRLTEADCSRLVHQTTGYDGPLNPQWLRPTRPRSILTRMLNNLRVAYLQDGSWERLIAVLEHLRVVRPDAPELMRDLGLVYFRTGELLLGLSWLEKYLERSPAATDAIALRQGLAPSLDPWVRLN